ncbi:hypothetical protein [Pseudomonas sp. C9-3]|uniref:hypothetical protein n=1 Tax=Pseudomonas sp. C9-3 TaxID=3078264 RepID=UPI0028E4291C|nr:hypothetical protein [Pseudomonas sp. C9-3]
MKTQSKLSNIAMPYYLPPLANQMGSKLGKNEKSLRKVVPLIAKRTSATQELAHASRALHSLYRFDPPFPIIIISGAITAALEESLFFREIHIFIKHKNIIFMHHHGPRLHLS